MTAQEFIRKMVVLYGPPDSANPTEFLSEFQSAIDGASPEALDKAWPLLRSAHRRRGWPAIPDVTDAISSAAAIVEADSLRRRSPAAPGSWRFGVMKANGLIRCPLGEQAVREGWILSLWDFCRQHLRLPNGYEIQELKQIAADHRQVGEELREQHASLFTRALMKLAASMEARRQQLAEIAAGERTELEPIRLHMDSPLGRR